MIISRISGNNAVMPCHWRILHHWSYAPLPYFRLIYFIDFRFSLFQISLCHFYRRKCRFDFSSLPHAGTFSHYHFHIFDTPLTFFFDAFIMPPFHRVLPVSTVSSLHFISMAAIFPASLRLKRYMRSALILHALSSGRFGQQTGVGARTTFHSLIGLHYA